MDDAHDGQYAREPQIEDLARIGRALNESGARYILIGGFAVIALGGTRTTKAIDEDVVRYTVVRVADEIAVDLMAKACGVDYADASQDARTIAICGVDVPVASLATLIRTK